MPEPGAAGSLLFERRPGSWVPMWRVAGAIFVAFPVVRIILEPPTALVAASALAATAIFAFLIIAVARSEPDDQRRTRIGFAVADVAIMALAVVTVANSPDQGWVLLFYYASSGASMLLPERRALALIVAAGVACAVSLTFSQDAPSAFIQGLSVSIIGITIFAMAALRRTNQQLHAAQAELATLAVADERDRIARDLHDVLGHSLSLIAIKSELAGRFLPAEPGRAKGEIADVERVARESLASLRDTVSGVRQPTLEGELENARVVLEAAGIESTIDPSAGALPSAEDAVLAWAVREAVTNVVRHSTARRATIRTSRHGSEAALEVVDDGIPADAVAGWSVTGGTGLIGLRARLERVGGRLDAGPRPDGGYRLEATIPIPASAAARGAG
jgi:two-component system, NarL family, sensor histidine kinase DesK